VNTWVTDLILQLMQAEVVSLCTDEPSNCMITCFCVTIQKMILFWKPAIEL